MGAFFLSLPRLLGFREEKNPCFFRGFPCLLAKKARIGGSGLRWPGDLQCESIGRKTPIFIVFERFARIASNLRFAILSAPKRDWHRGSVHESANRFARIGPSKVRELQNTTPERGSTPGELGCELSVDLKMAQDQNRNQKPEPAEPTLATLAIWKRPREIPKINKGFSLHQIFEFLGHLVAPCGWEFNRGRGRSWE